MTEITYNGINPFEGVAPTPFVSRTNEFIQAGERWGVKDIFTLNGQITGQCLTFEEKIALQNQIINNFSKDFQQFKIYDEALALTVSGNSIGVDPLNVSPMFSSSNFTNTVTWNAATSITFNEIPSNLANNQYYKMSIGVGSTNNTIKFFDEPNWAVTISGVDNFNTSGYFEKIVLIKDNSISPSLTVDETTPFDLTLTGDLTIDAGLSIQIQPLITNESGSLVYTADYTQITNISFPSNNYAFIQPFQITLEAYDSSLFSGAYGVLDPNKEITYTENPDRIVNITHTVSARGFNTSSTYNNALANAKHWVQSRTGLNNPIEPHFINYCSGIHPCLRSVNESIDRTNATYSIVETYTSDSLWTGAGRFKFTSQLNSGLNDGFSTLQLQGELQGCRFQDIDELRNVYFDLDKYSIASQEYENLTKSIDLNPTPLTSGITEDPFNKILTFELLFDNDPRDKLRFSYKTNFDFDFISDTITACIEGRVESRGPIQTRWQDVSGYYTGINLFNLLQGPYYNFTNSLTDAPYLTGYPLHPHPQSRSLAIDRFNATIDWSQCHTNKRLSPSGFDDFDYTLSWTPAIHQYKSSPCLDGEGTYVIFDLGYASRALLEVNVNNALISPDISLEEGIARGKNEIAALRAQYFSGNRMHLESQTEARTNRSQNKLSSLQATFTVEQDEFLL